MPSNGEPAATTVRPEENLGLVGFALRHLNPGSYDYDDYRQEGAMSLVRCARLYDKDKGAFSTYAVKACRGAFSDVRRRERRFRERSWQTRLGRRVTTRLNLFSELGYHFLTAQAPEFAREYQSGDDDRDHARATLADLMKDLDPRTAFVVRARFGFESDPMTYEEIGLVWGISKERVRQVFLRGLKSIRVAATGCRRAGSRPG